jgi:peptidyl-prolyl cis-trans isomerase SurA
LQRLQTTSVIPTKTGFLILQVGEHYTAGQQPEDKVDGEIQDRLYNDRLRPALRTYLEMLRESSYVQVKPGYTDSAAVASSTIDEVAPTADDDDKSKKKKKNQQPATQPASAKNGE